MRRTLCGAALAALLAAAGCAGLAEALLRPSRPGGDSPALTAGRSLAEAGVLGPWGQLALIGLSSAQNLYLAGRQVHRHGRRRGRVEGAPTSPSK